MLQVGTPDSMAESMLPSVVDPRDYDHIRFMQMNGGTGNNFEETIHRVRKGSIFTSSLNDKVWAELKWFRTGPFGGIIDALVTLVLPYSMGNVLTRSGNFSILKITLILC